MRRSKFNGADNGHGSALAWLDSQKAGVWEQKELPGAGRLEARWGGGSSRREV